MSRPSIITTERVGNQVRLQIVTSYGVRGPAVLMPEGMVPGVVELIRHVQATRGFELYGESEAPNG